MTDLVKIEVNNYVADVKLNRPEKRNALSNDLIYAIDDALKSLAANKDIRVIVLSGEGKAFCAGIDITNFTGGSSGSPPEFTSSSLGLIQRHEGRKTNIYQQIAYGWKNLPAPVITAIHGVAYGGGCQMALSADIRLATPDSKISIMEIKWGLLPDMSASQTLRDLVRIDVAKELTYTGKIISGQEAFELGLVTRVCDDPLSEAHALAKEIAGKNPDAIKASKQLFNETWHGSDREGLLMESALENSLILSPNMIEAVTAEMEKREPKFK